MTSLDRDAAIRLAPDPIRGGHGRPPLREIADYSDPDRPQILLAVPNGYCYLALAALRAAFRAGREASDDDPRYEDPRWWSSECSRCGGVEWHRASCRETGSTAVECKQCGVGVVSWKADAAAAAGWWHRPGCELFTSREPGVELTVEIHGKLTKAQWQRVCDLLDMLPGDRKYKGSAHYVFHRVYTVEPAGWSPAGQPGARVECELTGDAVLVSRPLDVERADALCAYLEDIGRAYSRETTTRWQP